MFYLNGVELLIILILLLLFLYEERRHINFKLEKKKEIDQMRVEIEHMQGELKNKRNEINQMRVEIENKHNEIEQLLKIEQDLRNQLKEAHEEIKSYRPINTIPKSFHTSVLGNSKDKGRYRKKLRE